MDTDYGKLNCMGKIEPGAGSGFLGRIKNRGPQWAVLLLLAWICWSCALRPVPRDLAAYVNRDIYAIAELESLALKRYDAVTGENYTSDAKLRQALDSEIIPAYSRFSSLINQIEPQTEPVKHLHAFYRHAANLRLQGLRMVMLAIDTQDPLVVRHANRMLTQGQHAIDQWRTRLAQLAGQYGLELKVF